MGLRRNPDGVCGPVDSRRRERAVVGAAAEEDDPGEQDAERPEKDGLRDASGSRDRVHAAARLPWAAGAAGASRLAANGVLHIVYPSLIADPRRVGRLTRTIRP